MFLFLPVPHQAALSRNIGNERIMQQHHHHQQRNKAGEATRDIDVMLHAGADSAHIHKYPLPAALGVAFGFYLQLSTFIPSPFQWRREALHS